MRGEGVYIWADPIWAPATRQCPNIDFSCCAFPPYRFLQQVFSHPLSPSVYNLGGSPSGGFPPEGIPSRGEGWSHPGGFPRGEILPRYFSPRV